MSIKNIKIRQAEIDDIPIIIKLRIAMFKYMEEGSQDQLNVCEKACQRYFEEGIPKEKCTIWLAETDTGEIVGSGAVLIDEHIPTPSNPSGKIGYILNIVTLPEYRRQEIATKIIKEIQNWCEKSNIQRMELHASDMGREIYKKLGFEESNAMIKKL